MSDPRTTLLIAYGLFVLAPFNGATAIAGVVLVYLRRGEMIGTPWESHARNLIHVFWIGAVAATVLIAIILFGVGGTFVSLVSTNGNPPPAMIGALLVLLPIVYLACLIFAVWYLYRTLRGLTRAIENRAY